MKYAVEIKNLTKDFGSFALRDVSLAIPGGTILGLIGENGAGKSTLIKCLLGILHPDGGEVELLEGAGYEIVPFQERADVYIINTCTVTNIADRKSRQMLHRARKMNPAATTTASPSEAKALTSASTLFSTHRTRSPRMASGIGAMAASKSKST